MTRFKAICCVLLAATAGCGQSGHEPTSPEPGPIVVARVRAELVPGGVRVTNQSSSSISFQVVNSYWLGQLAPCNMSPRGCTDLRSRARVVVPNDQIYGLDDAPASLVVYYWHPGDQQPTQIPVKQN
jgi:hypothetical protein